MKSIAVTRPNMAVLQQDRMGLSSFGMLSALFGEEILRRSQRRLGIWRPVPLELLEEEAASLSGQQQLSVNLDLTLFLKSLHEEQRKAQQEKREKKESDRTIEKLLERMTVREQTLRVREGTQQINIQAAALGRNHTIRVTRTPRRRETLEPVSSVTAVPFSGGWQPQWRPEHPGFSQKRQSTAGMKGGSILLPDALRRRREQLLEEAVFSAAVNRVEELTEDKKIVRREELKWEVSRSVEETLARQRRIQTAERVGTDSVLRDREGQEEKTGRPADLPDGSTEFQEKDAEVSSENILVYREDEDIQNNIGKKTDSRHSTVYGKDQEKSEAAGKVPGGIKTEPKQLMVAGKQKCSLVRTGISAETRKETADRSEPDSRTEPVSWKAQNEISKKIIRQTVPQGVPAEEKENLRDIDARAYHTSEKDEKQTILQGEPVKEQPEETLQGTVLELVYQKDKDHETQTVLQGTPVKEQLEETLQDTVTELVYQ
ncbi:MAG: hypothetical protein K2O18_10675, partial [Oscillospiraceae bacterium]|nr:hypothetical protein [Oscillospiraceae bacterium]